MTDSSELNRQGTLLKTHAAGKLFLDALNPQRKKKGHRARGCRGGANRRRGKFNHGKSPTRPLVEKTDHISISSESKHQHSFLPETFKVAQKIGQSTNSPPPLVRSWSLLSSASSSSCNSNTSFDVNSDAERMAPVASGLTNMPEEAVGSLGSHAHIIPILPSNNPLACSLKEKENSTHSQMNYNLVPTPNSSRRSVTRGIRNVFLGMNQQHDTIHPSVDHQSAPVCRSARGGVAYNQHNASLRAVNSNTSITMGEGVNECDNIRSVAKQREVNPKGGSFFMTSPRSFLMGRKNFF